MTAENAPFTGIRNSAITGKADFLTPIVVILMQTKQKSFSTNKHMGPTRSIGTFTSIALKQMGADITMVKGGDSKAVAADAAAKKGIL